MPPFHVVDTRAFPCVRVCFTGLPKDDAEFQAFLDELTRLYTRKQRFTVLFDTRKFGALPRAYIKGLSHWISENRENARLYLEKSAVLIANPLVRVFLEALFVVSKPTAPLKIESNLRDCVTFLGWKVHHEKQ